MIPEESIQTKPVGQHQQRAALPSWNGAPLQFFGAAFDVMRDSWNNAARADEAAKAYRRSERSAAAATAAQRANQAEAERYNSIPEQVRQLRQAGLSPSLAYGTISPGSVSGAGAASASSPMSEPQIGSNLGSGVAAAVTQSQLAAAQVENLRTNSASQSEDVVTKRAENELIRSKTQLSILEQIARIDKMVSDKNLNEENVTNLKEMRDHLQNYYDSLTQSNSASAALSTEKVNTEKTTQALQQGQASVQPSIIKLNEAAAGEHRSNANFTDGARTELAYKQAYTEETRAALNIAESKLANVKSSELMYQLNLNQKQYDTIHKYVKEHDFPAGSEKAIMLALEEFSRTSGKAVPENLASWLNSNVWVGLLKDLIRTYKWSPSQEVTDHIGASNAPDPEPKSVPRRMPSGSVEFPSSLRTHVSKIMEHSSPEQRSKLDRLRFYYASLPSYSSKYGLQMELYYCKTANDIERVCDKYLKD